MNRRLQVGETKPPLYPPFIDYAIKTEVIIIYTDPKLWVSTLHFCACSESKNRSYNILILYKIQGFAETLQIMSFQNDWYILHRRGPSKGTFILKSHTFKCDI